LIYERLTPFLFKADPERMHRLSMIFLSAPRFTRYLFGLIDTKPAPPSLQTSLLGLTFPNPVGLAAGYDKDGQAVDGCLDLGFGFTEVGSVTPFPQPGNPVPRVFRLPEDRSVINRYGFNSQGAAAVAAILSRRYENRQAMLDWERKRAHDRLHGRPPLWERMTGAAPPAPKEPPKHVSAAELGIVGVNLGKNKTSDDAGEDYAAGVAALGPLAHYLVVNVSSPNTPGLRDLQGPAALPALLARVLAARDALPARAVRGFPERPAVLVKVAPDLTLDERADVAAACLGTGVDGLVVANTTVARPASLKSNAAVVAEAGGLSGAAVKDVSTEMVADLYTLTEGRLPIIGVGGVETGADAWDKVRAGASLVQMYTGLVYRGPVAVKQVKEGLAAKLQDEGLEAIGEAVGRDAAGMRSAGVTRALVDATHSKAVAIAKESASQNSKLLASVGVTDAAALGGHAGAGAGAGKSKGWFWGWW